MKATFLSTVAAITLLAGAASAGTITIQSVYGSFTSLTGGFDTTGVGTNEVGWGNPNPSGGGQSGYEFVGAFPPSDSFAEDELFDMGTFTHFNYPIDSGTSITGATLQVTFEFIIDADPLNVITRTSTFIFDHWETTNNASPCADGGNVGFGVNVNGCADRVTALTNPNLSESFVIGDDTYLFNVTGFNVGSAFWTQEGGENSAFLVGQFTLESNVPPVPLPAAGLLLLAGLGALGAVAKRRRS